MSEHIDQEINFSPRVSRLLGRVGGALIGFGGVLFSGIAIEQFYQAGAESNLTRALTRAGYGLVGLVVGGPATYIGASFMLARSDMTTDDVGEVHLPEDPWEPIVKIPDGLSPQEQCDWIWQHPPT